MGKGMYQFFLTLEFPDLNTPSIGGSNEVFVALTHKDISDEILKTCKFLKSIEQFPLEIIKTDF
jgi:hypothetical protein